MHFPHRHSLPPGSWSLRMLVLFALGVGFPLISLAQMDQGTINGTVQDTGAGPSYPAPPSPLRVSIPDLC
jgi:hypothetical protein